MARKNRRDQTSGLDRVPPHSEEAERAVLGACIADARNCLPLTLAALRSPAGFYVVAHQNLFAHLQAMFERNEPIEMVTVMARLVVGDAEGSVGGRAYWTALPDVGSSTAIEHYLAIVREKMLLRQFIRVATEGVQRIFERENDAAEVMDAFEREVMAVSRDRVQMGDTDWAQAVSAALGRIDDYHRGGAQMRGLPTGFDYLDKMLCGLAPAEMFVLGGRPSTGKTSLACDFMEHVSINCKLGVGFFSLEMTGEQLAERAIFKQARADYQRFRTGYMVNEDVPKLINAAGRVASAPVKLDESSDRTIMDIRAKARRWVMEDGVKLLVIDYAQLVKGTRSYRERRDEVGEVSRGVKAMAKELKIPVVLLAQLNRELEKDKYRIPQLSDLKESGDLEQDADVVGILYRPKLTAEEQAVVDEGGDWARHSARINLQICKQRNGPTGKVELLFEKACMRFSSYKRAKTSEEQSEL